MEKNLFAKLISTLGRFDRANKKKSVIYTLMRMCKEAELVVCSHWCTLVALGWGQSTPLNRKECDNSVFIIHNYCPLHNTFCVFS